ncbi:50S ribosomal protein L16 [Candidatus Shapirobacteria bacterium]|nr:50S ribosomal protein L16 [Candidatus Shapirobacteria bacterium]
MVVPKKFKYRKQFRPKIKGKASRGYRLAFGDFGLKAQEGGWLEEKQLEAARQAIIHQSKREGKVWIRVVNDRPVTAKGAGVRMGKGKGDIKGYVASVEPGRIIFEVGGLPSELAQKALRLAGHKLPFKTKIIAKSE